MRNPVVFVEGFDFFRIPYYDPYTGDTVRFGRIGWDVITRGLSNGNGFQIFKEMPIQLNHFQQNGYDMIYLDIEDGTDYIQRSALLVIKLLEKINDDRACGGNETIIIGASMGGQVVRFALAQMEQQNRYHGVRTFVSFDSPHQGAVVPMGVQAAVWGLAHLAHSSNIDDGTLLMWDGLNSPAARQMLYETFQDEVEKGNLSGGAGPTDLILPLSLFVNSSLDYDCLRNSFVSERSALGYPKYARNVAMINGSKTSLQQAFNPWDNLVRVEKISAGIKGFELIIRPAPNDPVTELKLPNGYAAGVPTGYNHLYVDATGFSPYEIAPGCMQTFTKILADELAKKDGMNVIDKKPTHCFMPSISTLDINTTNLNYDINMNLYPNSPNPNLTPFQAYHAPDTNEPHVKLTSAGRAFLNNEMFKNVNPLAGITLSSGQSYNFGGDFRFLNNFTVGSGAVVRVNKPAYPIGDPSSGNPNPTGDFEARVGKCGITIEDGGLLEIGKGLVNRATLRVVKGSTVLVESGGEIRIDGYSKLIIEEGAQLILEEGAIVNYWGTGTANAATLRVEGTLIIQDDGSDFARIFGAGRMEVAGTATVDIQTDARLELDGQGSNNVILDLEQNARIGVDGDGRLTVRNGDVTYADNSTIFAEHGGELRVINANLSTTSGTNAIETDDAYRVLVQGATFDGFGMGIFVYNGQTNATMNYSVTHSTFDNCDWSIVIENTTSFKAGSNTFNGSNGLVGIWAMNTEVVKVTNCDFTDYLYRAIDLSNVPVCQIKSSNIDDGLTGIHAINKSNVFLSHGTVIKNNTIGIELYGDAEDGMVSMNCATLDGNGTGIKGTDALLDIDAEIHAFNQGYISPNTFKNFGGSNLLFDICYVQRDINEVFAKANYWDGLTTLSPTNDYLIHNGGGSCNTTNVTLNMANYTTTTPLGCNYETPTGTGSTSVASSSTNLAVMMAANQCNLNVNSQTYAVHTQYKLGDEKFKEDEFEEADLKYAPVSALEGPVRDGSSTQCRHYIDVAHVMVKVEEILNNQKSGRSINTLDLWDDAAKVEDGKQRIATLNAYPNPATDLVTIRVMDNIDGSGFIKLYNALGQLVYSDNAYGNIIEVSVSELAGGLYRAEWINDAGDWAGFVKVLIE